jgi:hypothetical protein
MYLQHTKNLRSLQQPLLGSDFKRWTFPDPLDLGTIPSLSYQLFTFRNSNFQAKDKINLWPTVSQPICLGVNATSLSQIYYYQIVES